MMLGFVSSLLALVLETAKQIAISRTRTEDLEFGFAYISFFRVGFFWFVVKALLTQPSIPLFQGAIAWTEGSLRVPLT